MNVKLRQSLIPTCITFGPLFATRFCGLIEGRIGSGLAWIGTIMLTAGLYMMYELITYKQGIQNGIDRSSTKTPTTSE